MAVKITTNYHRRELLTFAELTDKEREEFDYVTDENEWYNPRFFRYRKATYDSHEFERCELGGELQKLGWDGFQSDSYFSATLLKYWQEETYMEPDFDWVVVGSAYWD